MIRIEVGLWKVGLARSDRAARESAKVLQSHSYQLPPSLVTVSDQGRMPTGRLGSGPNCLPGDTDENGSCLHLEVKKEDRREWRRGKGQTFHDPYHLSTKHPFLPKRSSKTLVGQVLAYLYAHRKLTYFQRLKGGYLGPVSTLSSAIVWFHPL